MMALSPTLIVAILLLIALAGGCTCWLFRRQRALDRAGALKGTARTPGEVRRQNPPDQSAR